MERRLRRRKFVGTDQQLMQLLKEDYCCRRIFESVKLERVLGLTVNNGAALACDSQNGIIAYPAGCTVVLYSAKKNRQAHIINASKKQISCLAFSPDGKYLATGESGHQPAVRVWDADQRSQFVELPGHKFGIVCVAFSPNMKYLVSVGNQHDMVVNVWNWRNNSKIASNKVSCKVKALSFSENGSYFVTVGVRHVKFWYLERSKTAKYQGTMPLQGRSAILADQRNNNFCDVVCGTGPTASSTFCITQSGLLCEFNSRRLLEKWVELKTSCASSMALGNNAIYVGCGDGIVRVFQADSLTFLATLPRPHYLGVDVAAGMSPAHMMSCPAGAKFPDTVALCFDSNLKRLTCIYSDHSLYLWDVNDFKKIGKVASFLYHSSCIWGVEVYPVLKSGSPSLPPGTFLTCGSDDTIRMWNLDPNMPNDMTPYKRNIYSQELLKVLYTDPEYQFLCDSELNSAQLEKPESQIEGKNGVRVIKVSPDGRHLATGDRKGNLRVFRVNDSLLLRELEAHDGDILALEYTNYDLKGPYFLVSASRDRIIHVLDVEHLYEHVCSMEGHSAAVTSVKFGYNLRSKTSDLTMLSCGSDKTIIFWKYSNEPESQFARTNCVAAPMTLYDMEVDPLYRWVYTACQDRQIRIYNLGDGKLRKSYKGSLSDDGTLIKLQLENSGSYIATSCSDKNLSIFDVRGGDCVATMFGHGELVTGMKFTNDFRHLITVSGDGCIFVWRISNELTNQMLSNLASLEKRLVSAQSVEGADYDDTDDTASEFSEEPANQTMQPANQKTLYEPDPSELPSWARRQLNHPGDDTPEQANLHRPGGKWGQRMAPEGGASYQADATPRKSSRDFIVTDEIFLGPGNQELIKDTFYADAQGKSPIGTVNYSRGYDHQQMSRNFGSLANVRLTGDDDDVPANQNSSSLIIYPDVNSNLEQTDSKEFEVKERSAEISKTKNYNRTDTLGNELSDDEDSNIYGARSSSNLNLKDNFPADSKDDLHPRQHKMVLDAYEKLDDLGALETISPEPMALGAFERNGSGRHSITSKFLQKTNSGRYNLDDSTANNQSPTSSAWGSTPVRSIVSQIESLKTQYDYGSRPGTASSVTSSLSGPSSTDVPTSRLQARPKWGASASTASTPTGPTPSSVYPLMQSESVNAVPSWTYKPPAAKTPLSIATPNLNLDVDPKNVLRAKTLSDLSKNRERRRTFSSFAFSITDDEIIEDEDPRRRSRSPAASLLSRRDSGNSVFSSPSIMLGRGRETPGKKVFSYFNGSTSTLTSAGGGILDAPRLSTSLSMSSLAHNPDADSNNTVKKISDLREKLRKSQENLALSSTTAEYTPPTVSSSGVGRSKSIGSLTHAQHQESSRDAKTTATSANLASTLRQARELTKSVGNLHRADSSSRPSRPLTETLKDFRKISNPDLTKIQDDEEHYSNDNASVVSEYGSFYSATSSTTLPRYRKASGVVQKKSLAARSAPRYNRNTDRASASGDSEDSSDTSGAHPHAHPRTNPVTRSASGLISKRQATDTYGSPRRTPSVLETSSRSTASQQLITSTPVRAPPPETPPNRRNSSYLAKILSDEGAGGEKTGRDTFGGANNKRNGVANLVASEGSESCDGHYEKMSSHCKDSVGQFRTALDKILQAYQMVTNDSDLTDGDRENLQSLLKGELEEARRRMSHTLNNTFVRHQPDGGDEPIVVSPSTATLPSLPVAGDPAASAILQQYSDILVNMIQQKMGQK